MLEIPANATIKQEYVKCGNPDCHNLHGPYLYAYWKEGKKLKKKYIGKNLEDFAIRKIAKEVKLRPRQPYSRTHRSVYPRSDLAAMSDKDGTTNDDTTSTVLDGSLLDSRHKLTYMDCPDFQIFLTGGYRYRGLLWYKLE